MPTLTARAKQAKPSFAATLFFLTEKEFIYSNSVYQIHEFAKCFLFEQMEAGLHHKDAISHLRWLSEARFSFKFICHRAVEVAYSTTSKSKPRQG
jgi:hypothetical protein